ncbi:hypothetical protein ElyMa_005547700 [Elysia marginata]|uniref:C2H2-type domain-containing protein n=1 Tax=Elysia marginata TaxID=1093978 RepID=A0AAV4F017_9GAST|nr:hypothetical protein ElyMa_005547700 [Elysia marginata]
MDEYVEKKLVDMPDSPIHDVIRNILDEPIPEAIKRRLLKPLQPRKYQPIPPPSIKKTAKIKAIEEEFDPLPRRGIYGVQHTTDESVEKKLVEIFDSPIHDVIRNILDAPIPEAIKRRLLKPLQPRKYQPIPPPRRKKAAKRKSIEEEFDPLPRSKGLRSVKDYEDEILEVFEEERRRSNNTLTFWQTPWTIGNFLRGWQMDVPRGEIHMGFIEVLEPFQTDTQVFLEVAKPQICKKLKEELKDLGSLKFQLALKVLLKMPIEKEDKIPRIILTDPIIRHEQEPLLHPSEIGAALSRAFGKIFETLDNWTKGGSGWIVVRVQSLWLNIARYQPLRGGSYIPLPTAVRNKKAVVNVKNQGDACLLWTLLASLFRIEEHPERISHYYLHANLLNFDGIDTRTPISQIPKVERQNNLAINVFGWQKGVIVYHISKQHEVLRRINVLLIEEAEKFHYTWITDLDRLLYDQNNHREKTYFCERCLHGYTNEALLEKHKPACRGIGQTAVRVEMPEEGKNKLTFQNHHRQLPAPYIIYADFEALTTKIEGPELDPDQSNTQQTHHHEACSWCYIKVRCDGLTEAPVEYRGPDAAERLLQNLQEEERMIKRALAKPQDMIMTGADLEAYEAATNCHVCDGPLNGDSVRDHCHITGKYRGAAHSACNAQNHNHTGSLPQPAGIRFASADAGNLKGGGAALTTKIEGPELDPDQSNTQQTHHHEACSWCYIKVRCDGLTEAPVEYRGPDAAEHLLRALQEEERMIKKVLAKPQDMLMNCEDTEAHRTATT